MGELAYEEEIRLYSEGLLVVSGQLKLRVDNEAVVVEAGQMYLAQAGVAHSVLAGSLGALVIIDI